MSDMKIDNLIFRQGGNGIYLFFNNDNKCIYVGSGCSKSFVERIPAHFDVREHIGWGFRGVCKRIREEMECYWYDAAVELLKCYLYLINFKENNNKERYCKSLEKLLIYKFREHPLYNRSYRNRDQEINDQESLIVNLGRII
jgi:hypothetical protein